MYEWIILNCHNWLIKKIWFVYESDITASQMNRLTQLINLWMLQAQFKCQSSLTENKFYGI